MAKQVCDCRSTKGICQAESDEQQRRWSEKQWKNKSSYPKLNYDVTRNALNFEVTRGGKIQKIDTSKSIDTKIREMCAERGMRYPNDPNPRLKAGADTGNIKEKLVAAQFIFGGSRDRMHELAFGGSDVVNLNKGADNSSVRRKPEIELWAQDIYRFVANRYGEENIASFYVHLDETNPHCHVTVLPVAMIKGKERVSWNRVFGGQTPEEVKAKFRALHDDYYNTVGKKWGLERGEPISETGAKHRSLREWQADSAKAAYKAEKAVKGLTTMISNLESRRTVLESEIEKLLHNYDSSQRESTEKLNALRAELNEIEIKIYDKKSKLHEAENNLKILKEEQLSVGHQVHNLKQELYTAAEGGKNLAMTNIAAAFLDDIVGKIQGLTGEQQDSISDIMQDGLLADLADGGQELMLCGAMLYLGLVDAVTAYSASHGGGGGGGNNDLPRRKKDEDDFGFARRCASAARKLMKKPQRSRRR